MAAIKQALRKGSKKKNSKGEASELQQLELSKDESTSVRQDGGGPPISPDALLASPDSTQMSATPPSATSLNSEHPPSTPELASATEESQLDATGKRQSKKGKKKEDKRLRKEKEQAEKIRKEKEKQQERERKEREKQQKADVEKHHGRGASLFKSKKKSEEVQSPVAPLEPTLAEQLPSDDHTPSSDATSDQQVFPDEKGATLGAGSEGKPQNGQEVRGSICIGLVVRPSNV